MNWDEMSDGEINFKLWNLHAKIPEGHATICVYDYCNSWADMGPLIAKYRIGVEAYDLPEENPMSGYWFCLTGYGFDDDVVEHKNPLRAAAICLINKLESENAKV